MRSFSSDSARSLLAYLISCKQNKRPGPVLFLGAGASITSGCPSTEILLSHISQRLGRQIQDLNDLENALNEQQLQLEIAKALSGKTPGLGYRLLAQLVLRGYFDVILTTNWDFLLEQEVRRNLDPENFNVYTRPLVSDKKLAGILAKGIETPCLIRLHGDLVTKPVISPKELLTFKDDLEREIRSMITERGIIIIGYSMQEIRISTLISTSNNAWYIGPFNVPNNQLQQLNIQPKNTITSDDALFDNFFESLCFGLLNAELTDRIMYDERNKFSPYNEKIDSIVDSIKRGLLADTIPDSTIEDEIVRILRRCRDILTSDRSRTCLVFIDDPSAPGGIAMFDLVMRTSVLKRAIEGYEIAVAKIEGRVGTLAASRNVVSIININNRDLSWSEIETVVLIDTVSFTASTLMVTQKYIQANFNKNSENFIIAVLRLDSRALERLKEHGIRTVSNDTITTRRFVVPWGVTRPTSPPQKPHQLKPSIQVPFDVNLFLPASSFWYNPKPWGDITEFAHNSNLSTRILFFERFQRTSLHFHFLRDEIFIALDDNFILQLWDRQIVLGKHQTVRVPAGVPHRLIALDTPCRIFEIALGEYEDQKDIYRLEDIYNRKRGWESDGLV